MREAESSRLAAIHDYFLRKFPGWTIDHQQETADSKLEVFTIIGGPTTQTFKVKFSLDFLEGCDTLQIEQILEQWQVGDFVRVSGFWPILVTRAGLHSLR